jgi:hypothetical protein
MESVQIDITLVATPGTEVFRLGNPDQVIKLAQVVKSVFGAKLNFQEDVKIAERPQLPSDPTFDASMRAHEPLDDDGLLGVYYSSKSKIEIFLDNCSKVADHLGQTPGLIAQKVLLHELAHLVSHLGGFKGTCLVCTEEASFNWSDFGDGAAELKEHFAQLGAYLANLDLYNDDLEVAMAELSKHQSPRYRSWEPHRAFVQDGVPIGSVKRGFQDQFLTFLQSKPQNRQVRAREHVICFDPEY